MDEQKKLANLLNAMRGLRCWHVSTGGAAGPSMELAFGEKIPRATPLKNLAQPEEFRLNEGEINVLIWCTWRLDGHDGPLTSSDEGSDPSPTDLATLVGRAIVLATAEKPAWDLKLEFDNAQHLRVFCDHIGPNASIDSNWEIWTPEFGIIVTSNSRLEIEPRQVTALSQVS